MQRVDRNHPPEGPGLADDVSGVARGAKPGEGPGVSLEVGGLPPDASHPLGAPGPDFPHAEAPEHPILQQARAL